MSRDEPREALNAEALEAYLANYPALDSWLADYPTMRRLAVFMNYGYRDSFLQMGRSEAALARLVIDHARRSATDAGLRRAAEVGSGRGGNLAILAKVLPQAVTFGFDLTPQNLVADQSRHPAARGFRIQSDATKLPIGDASLDLILSIESSHSYPRLDSFVSELVRVAAPGGVIAWTDFMPPAVWDECIADLVGTGGVSLVDTLDISEGVLAARRRAGRIARILHRGPLPPELKRFMALPGSEMFEAFLQGSIQYRLVVARKVFEDASLSRSQTLELMGSLAEAGSRRD